MTDYFTPAGLADLQGYESSGNPTAQSSASTASGLYGFTNPTWQEYAPQAGVYTDTAAEATPEQQAQVAAITPASNWLCPGCDQGITNDVASNPSLLSSSPDMGFSAPDSFNEDENFFGEATNPEGAPLDYATSNDFAGGGVDYGAAAQAANQQGGFGGTAPISQAALSAAPTATGFGSVADWWQQLVGDIENLAARGGLVLIGIVLIAAAAFALSNSDVRGGIVRAVS